MKVGFTILGEPQGKGRPRFTRVGNYVKTYTPEATATYENLVKLEYERQCNSFRFDDSDMLTMEILAHYGIPKSASKKKQMQMDEGKLMPCKKPDIDNVIKVIADSLNNIAYKDDSQIVEVYVRKCYSYQPKVEVAISNSNYF